ncbi:MAG: DUF4962 domain-containing protein [Candidatus Anammoximicrobium sp.]|nr:DUF4962 domain-containing protein [Candidatus Anammoximicrobium sp.]
MRIVLIAVAITAGSFVGPSRTWSLDESPAREGEWGFRPAEGSVSDVNPPSFCWRPDKSVAAWELECLPESGGPSAAYRAAAVEFNVHCPDRTLPAGKYTWRYRGVDKQGQKTDWSRNRVFSIAENAVAMPLPGRDELLARIPRSHPRLFIRPEDLPRLRKLTQGELNDRYKRLTARCEQLLRNPPPTAEPPKYPEGTERLSESWRKTWWGNRTYTIAALDGAATLAFTHQLGGKQEYGQLAKRILLDCARWDPKGATGYRYNDEAGMPYAYHFSRTYTLVHDLLAPDERQACRDVMRVRGEEMYRHLCPRHLWQPYASHSNRAWHFLGEVGIAFLGEIEGADDWVWFAMNVFQNVYPVWSDDDGGWHEGASYWSSYLSRFTWWADVMRAAMGIDAYRKPFFSRVGFYPMYLMPPGKVGGGFGDLTARRRAADNVPLVSVLAAQAGNPYWQWYVEQLGGPAEPAGYVDFVRGTLPRVEPKSPDGLPASRLFRGTGQAYLNTTLQDAAEGVQVVFKSSPFGTQSHGYEANNSFLLWAYGQRLLIRSGYRDIYGSDHHRNWMWSTRSVNNITVGGQGQGRRTAAARGAVTAFATTPEIDLVVGQAGDAYVGEKTAANPAGKPLERFTRAIVFVKPELVIVYDRLIAREPARFEYWLHALNEMQVNGQHDILVRAGDVRCQIDFLAPDGLTFAQTDQYDPNPRPRITLREWHLTATTPRDAKAVQFVTLLRPHRAGHECPRDVALEQRDGGYILRARVPDGQVLALLPLDEQAQLAADGFATTGKLAVQRRLPNGRSVELIEPLRQGDGQGVVVPPATVR